MRLWTCLLLFCLYAPCHAAGTAATDGNPQACDCKTLDVSDREAAAGCPAQVKERTCPMYRDAQEWKQRLRDLQERRRLEKRMQPPIVPRGR